MLAVRTMQFMKMQLLIIAASLGLSVMSAPPAEAAGGLTGAGKWYHLQVSAPVLYGFHLAAGPKITSECDVYVMSTVPRELKGKIRLTQQVPRGMVALTDCKLQRKVFSESKGHPIWQDVYTNDYRHGSLHSYMSLPYGNRTNAMMNGGEFRTVSRVVELQKTLDPRQPQGKIIGVTVGNWYGSPATRIMDNPTRIRTGQSYCIPGLSCPPLPVVA